MNTLGIYMVEKAILIDGSNLYHSLKRANAKICYEKLRHLLTEGCQSIVTYYGSRPAKTPKEQLQFLFALQHKGYSLKINTLKKRHGKYVEKGVDAQIVDDLNTILQQGKIKEVVIVAGDKDYLGTLQKLQASGVSITIVSFENAISPELRLIANRFIPLNQHLGKILIKKEA